MKRPWSRYEEQAQDPTHSDLEAQQPPTREECLNRFAAGDEQPYRQYLDRLFSPSPQQDDSSPPDIRGRRDQGYGGGRAAGVEEVEGVETVPDLPPPPSYSPSWPAPRARRSTTDTGPPRDVGRPIRTNQSASLRTSLREETSALLSSARSRTSSCSMTVNELGLDVSTTPAIPRERRLKNEVPGVEQGSVTSKESKELKKRLEAVEAWIANSNVSNPSPKPKRSRLFASGIRYQRAIRYRTWHPSQATPTGGIGTPH